MAINLINIGNIANDGTGDDLREAFVKVNNNFEELDLRDNEKTTVSNIGEGIGLFDQIVNHDIQLKSILAGRNIAFKSVLMRDKVEISSLISSSMRSFESGKYDSRSIPLSSILSKNFLEV